MVMVAIELVVVPALLDTMQRYFRPLNTADMVKLNVALLYPVDEQLFQVFPSLLHCHWYFSPVPEAATVSLTVVPTVAVTDFG